MMSEKRTLDGEQVTAMVEPPSPKRQRIVEPVGDLKAPNEFKVDSRLRGVAAIKTE